MTALYDRMRALARTPILIVACDVDGTLAPIAPEPEQARLREETLAVIRALAAMPQTHTAIISGRARDDLTELTPWPESVRLVGSHGIEFDRGFTRRLSPIALGLRERILRELCAIAGNDGGCRVEEKPAGAALHYRGASKEVAAAVLERVRSGPATYEGVYVKEGRKVIELTVIPGDKGLAVARLRFETGATAVLFVGDDTTDEDAFAALTHEDVGIKVGPGETRALFRLDTPADVTAALSVLADQRSASLAAIAPVPIDHHSMLSDQRTIALVTPGGRVAWFCVPRIDSSAIFSELLGGAPAGYFEVRSAASPTPIRQEYLRDSLLLQTDWGSFTVTDYLDCADGRPFQRAGRTDLLRVLEGSGQALIRFAPRVDFGRVATRVRRHDDGLIVEGTPDPIVLHAPGVRWRLIEEGPHDSAVAEIELSGQTVVLELRCGTGSLRASLLPEPERRRQTLRHWQAWAATLSLPAGRHGELVRRSALTLRALCYRPTGAIAAAGTTSLPETAGGPRNWDYRFCWPRDAAMSSAALVRLGSTGQALRFLDWLMGVLDRCESPESLRPIYTVSGSHLGPEAEISELAGYRLSRPVRVGNAAAQQVQLDVFGAIAELLALLARRDAPVTPEHWRLAEAMVRAVERRWRDPDHGIWEPRLPPRHHVHSKVMCWQTVDRAQIVAEQHLGRRREDWDALARTIADDVLAGGWKPSVGAFVGAYGDDSLDAAALHVGLSGLLPPDDPRFVATVEAVERHLRRGPTLYRYRGDDGVPGTEGGFHLCTGWLVEAYLCMGRVEPAARLLDELASLAGPTGLFSEEYDPIFKMALGNHPQAYSHLGLINAAVRLAACAGGT